MNDQIEIVHTKEFILADYFSNFNNRIDKITVEIGRDKCFSISGGEFNHRIGVEQAEMYSQLTTLKMVSINYAVRWVKMNMK